MKVQIIKAKNIIVGRELVCKENAAIKIENGKIAEIYENASQIPKDIDAEIVDLENRTLIPGMIDCHNHLVKMNDCECEQMIRALKTMKDDLISGVTTVRRLRDCFYIDVTCRQAQREGRIIGPKLVVSGIGMRASHGHDYVGCPLTGRSNFASKGKYCSWGRLSQGFNDESDQCQTVNLSFYES